MSKNLLIVFVKNLVPGTVKKRLAKDIGEDLAMEVYKVLVANTADVVTKVKSEKSVYYNLYVELYDAFPESKFAKHTQRGEGLGMKMHNALADSLAEGYERVVLIGSDIPKISKKIIEDAFEILDKNDVVVGRAEDGGYYLIGLKKPLVQLFENKTYSHEQVAQELLDECKRLGLSVGFTKTLYDVDTQADMKKAGIQVVYEDEDEIEPSDE